MGCFGDDGAVSIYTASGYPTFYSVETGGVGADGYPNAHYYKPIDPQIDDPAAFQAAVRAGNFDYSIVDGDGNVVGTCSAAEVLAMQERERNGLAPMGQETAIADALERQNLSPTARKIDSAEADRLLEEIKGHLDRGVDSRDIAGKYPDINRDLIEDLTAKAETQRSWNPAAEQGQTQVAQQQQNQQMSQFFEMIFALVTGAGLGQAFGNNIDEQQRTQVADAGRTLGNRMTGAAEMGPTTAALDTALSQGVSMNASLPNQAIGRGGALSVA